MRVAIVGPSAPFRGGIAQHTDRVVEALRQAHEVDLYPFTRQYPKRLFPGRSQLDPTTEALPGSRVGFDPYGRKSWDAVVADIAKRQPDLVMVQWWHPWFALPLRGLLRRLKSVVPDRRVVICHNVLPHQKVPAQRMLSRLALKHADRFVVHADSEVRKLRDLLGAEPEVHRAFLPSLAPDLDQPLLDQAEARSALGLDDSPWILFFGLVRNYKGLDDLLAAMPLMRHRAKLYVAGEFYADKERVQRVIAEANLEDRVVLRDQFVPESEVASVFAAADVVSLPYRSATQSSVLALTVHYRRPFVVTDVGGLREAAQDLGAVVPPRDPRAMAEALDAYLGGASVAPPETWDLAAERFAPAGVVKTVEGIAKAAGGGADDAPKVSVVVAAHGACPHLRDTLLALAGQAGAPDLEVLVVYDGVVESLARRVPSPPGLNLRIVSEPSFGLNAKRNRGVAESSGDVVLFTDDDCVPDPHWVQRMAVALGESPLVTGAALPLGEGVRASVREGERRKTFGGWFDRLLPWRAGCGNNLGVRRSHLAALGGFDPRIGVGTPSGAGCDTELLFRAMSARGGSVLFEPAAIVQHRQEPLGDAVLDKRRRYYRGLSFMARRIHPRSPTAWLMAALRLGGTALATAWSTITLDKSGRLVHWAEVRGAWEGLFLSSPSTPGASVAPDACSEGAPDGAPEGAR